MVVVVARKDFWKKEYIKCCFFKRQYGEKLPADYSKEKICPQLLSKKLPFILILWELGR
jgi:hypothetical protein